MSNEDFVNNPLSFDAIVPHFQSRTPAFISITGGMSSMFFSKYLSRTIGMTEGDSVGFFAKEDDIKHNGDQKYMWAMYITKNTINTCELKRSKNQDMFRVNESKISKMLQEVFQIHKGKKVRLMVDTSKPIKFKDPATGKDAEMYMIYDLPPMRKDLEDAELASYNIDYITKMAKIRALGWAA